MRPSPARNLGPAPRLFLAVARAQVLFDVHGFCFDIQKIMNVTKAELEQQTTNLNDSVLLFIQVEAVRCSVPSASDLQRQLQYTCPTPQKPWTSTPETHKPLHHLPHRNKAPPQPKLRNPCGPYVSQTELPSDFTLHSLHRPWGSAAEGNPWEKTFGIDGCKGLVRGW